MYTLPHLHDDHKPTFKAPPIAAPTHNITLDIYIAGRCPICQGAPEYVERLRREIPNININLVDLDAPDTPKPDVVIAIPSFLINGYLVAAGNPDLEQLKRFIRSLD